MNHSFYKAANKRLIARGGDGRFRKGILSDIGLACCETCGVLFAPQYPDSQMIDPREFREMRRFCGDHGYKEKGKL